MFEAYRLSPPLETTAPIIAVALKASCAVPLPIFAYLTGRQHTPAGNVIRIPSLQESRT